MDLKCCILTLTVCINQVSNFDFPVIENVIKSIVKEKQPFERLVVNKQDLLEMFKVIIINYI